MLKLPVKGSQFFNKLLEKCIPCPPIFDCCVLVLFAVLKYMHAFPTHCNTLSYDNTGED